MHFVIVIFVTPTIHFLVAKAFCKNISTNCYYYVEMPHGPTMVKDGEEQINVVINLDDPTFDL